MIEGRRKDGSPVAFADWRNKRVAEITPDLVQRYHRKLSDEHGPAWANLAMRMLRLLINYALVGGITRTALGWSEQAQIIVSVSAKSEIQHLIYSLADYNPSADEVIETLCSRQENMS